MIQTSHFLAAAVMVASPMTVTGATVELTPVADTSLHEIAPDNNMGAHSHISVGSTANLTKSRGLVRFDLDGRIPPASRITGVTLSFQVIGLPVGGGAPSSFALHRLLQPWGEGNKTGNTGDAGTAGEATWRARRLPDGAWTAPGAASDATPQPSSTIPVAGVGTYTFPSTDSLAQDVAAWLANPSGNHGWLILSQSEGTAQTARRVASREDVARTPKLTITYETAEEPAPPTFTGFAREGNEFVIRFLVPSTYAYDLECTPTIEPAAWVTVTSAAAPRDPVPVEYRQSLLAPGQNFFRLRITGRVR